MQSNLHNPTGNQFTNYSENSITINKIEYTTNLIVSNLSIEATDLNDIKNLSLNQLTYIIETHKPDLIIFGTGNTIVYPDMKLLAHLSAQRIGFEIMPIPALCRTFNYLIGEGRNVTGLILF